MRYLNQTFINHLNDLLGDLHTQARNNADPYAATQGPQFCDGLPWADPMLDALGDVIKSLEGQLEEIWSRKTKSYVSKNAREIQALKIALKKAGVPVDSMKLDSLYHAHRNAKRDISQVNRARNWIKSEPEINEMLRAEAGDRPQEF